jgi:tetratricopeptide (TPR) repeat protein
MNFILSREQSHPSPEQFQVLAQRLSNAYDHSGHFAASEDLLARALDWVNHQRRRSLGEAADAWAITAGALYHRRGGLHTAWASEFGQYGDESRDNQERWKAIEAHREAVRIYESVLGAESMETLTHKRCLGCMYLNVGEVQEARRQTLPAAWLRSRHVHRLLSATGLSLWRMRQPALDLVPAETAKQMRLLAGEFGILGCVAMRRRRLAQARSYFDRELYILDCLDDGSLGFTIASSAARLAEALEALGTSDRTKQLRERSRNILTTHPNAKYLRYNCRLDVPKVRKELNAPLPKELEQIVRAEPPPSRRDAR